MKTKHMLGLLILLMAVAVIPASGNSITIQLAPLVPVGSCTPTAGTTCVGPHAVAALVPGLGTLTMTAFKPLATNSGLLGVTVDPNVSPNILYVGVTSGNNQDEIDLEPPTETLVLTFSPSVVTTLVLNKLFPPNVRGDSGYETASVQFYANNILQGTALIVAATNTGVLSVNLPFGNVVVDELRFGNFSINSTTNASNSDYGISSLTVIPIPEPGSLALLGTGLLGLAARRRSRQTFP